ncbi:MAG: SCO family protein [Cyclobacteriaceae bacterium]|nr:SCO family protein [Cyclobacteriaceae bacterium]
MKFHQTVFLSMMMLVFIAAGCKHMSNREKLPFLGRKQINPVMENNGVSYDTIYHTIGDFSFVDQDSNRVDNDTFRDHVYVADFFFTTCPTICPVMKAQMLRVYETFETNDVVMFLSHTIDPDYDTVALLHDFAERLGVSSEKWHFVTGLREDIYDIGQNSYMVTAMEDKDEPGGYIHSGAFILVDKERHIRGLYDGTDENEVNRLIKDISRLLSEYENS